mmetsp:Transcript_48115/g.113113  ORF Transcript_48115/g.113113 Transcript_48115/m.113113 type:complete len:206 (-) Transcript_48115:407-1024(-)
MYASSCECSGGMCFDTSSSPNLRTMRSTRNRTLRRRRPRDSPDLERSDSSIVGSCSTIISGSTTTTATFANPTAALTTSMAGCRSSINAAGRMSGELAGSCCGKSKRRRPNTTTVAATMAELTPASPAATVPMTTGRPLGDDSSLCAAVTSASSAASRALELGSFALRIISGASVWKRERVCGFAPSMREKASAIHCSRVRFALG